MFSLQDSQRLIVAPHLLLMPIPLPGSEVDDVTLTAGLYRYLCPHLPFCKRNILISFQVPWRIGRSYSSGDKIGTGWVPG